jgi:putative membrane protein
MIGFFVRALIVALGLWIATLLVPGVGYRDLLSLILAGVVIGVLNALVRPIAVLLSLPFLILTLGLFMLVINAAILELASIFIHGIYFQSFFAAILASLVVSLTSFIAYMVIRD